MNPFDLKSVLLAKHAQHVALVHFPIALIFVSVAFDLLSLRKQNLALLRAAYYTVIAAAIAAESGAELNGVGVMPDVSTPQSRTLAEYRSGHDPQLAAAVAASYEWRRSSLSTRTAVMFRFHQLLDAHRRELAAAVTAEHGKVLSEARREAVATGVRAVVFVGDAMEESVDDLCVKAGELGLLKVPVFMFQEGHDAAAEQAFREIARLTGGAWCRFDPGAAAQLRELLRAAAAYAAGGREALLRLSKSASGAAKLLGQMK